VQYQMPAVGISNNHMPVLPYVRAIMDAHGLIYRTQPSVEPAQEGRLPYWDIRTAGVTRTQPCLRLLLPYLHTKRAQAEEMLAYCHQNSGPTPRIAASTKARIRELYATGTYTKRALADLYGISVQSVYKIVGTHGWRRARPPSP
jgi:hypothetical protein